jgi:hypothetical protein
MHGLYVGYQSRSSVESRESRVERKGQ